MITMRIKGGLGNQLFQYAVGYALAKRLNQPLQLDISYFPTQSLRGFKLDKLAIPELKVTDQTPMRKDIQLYTNKYFHHLLVSLKGKRVIRCGKENVYLFEHGSTYELTEEVFSVIAPIVYVDGFFQCEKYFADIAKALQAQYTPSYEPDKEYLSALDRIKRRVSVAVHVRRGDFLNIDVKRNTIAYVLDERYYKNALDYIRKKVSDPVFYWFSDDIEWVKRVFGVSDDFQFVSLHTKNADIDEMMLMKNCNHIITANSTFSWWAAWLNDSPYSIRIVPAKQYGNIKMIPEDWIRIAVE